MNNMNNTKFAFAPAASAPTLSSRGSSLLAASSSLTTSRRTAYVAPRRKAGVSRPLRFSVRASSVSGTPAPSSPVPDSREEKKKSSLQQTLKVGSYIFLWYAFNIVYNISNKRVLNWFPMPWFVSWVQLLIGVMYVFPQWMLGIRKKPVVPNSALKTLLPISIGHTVGHVSTVVSLGAVAVSFTHVVKAMEPFVNVVGSAIFLKSFFPFPVYASLLPVVAGVIFASVSEVSFTWLGFCSAMTSNFAFTARNIFSKLSMNQPKGENMNAPNLFAVLSIMSTVLLFPFAMIMDNPVKLKNAFLAATTGATAVVSAPTLIGYILISGLFFYLYQEVAFKALDSVHPITHAVANTVKRVVVIITSIIVFRNTITANTAIGSAVALLGVLLYSITKNYFPEKKKAIEPAA